MNDLTTPDGVLLWADQTTHRFPDASVLAMAMRYKSVWEKHRDKLADISEPARFSRTNRETLARAIRALCYAMTRAQKGLADEE